MNKNFNSSFNSHNSVSQVFYNSSEFLRSYFNEKINNISMKREWPDWLNEEIINEILEMHTKAAEVLWFSQNEILVIKNVDFAKFFVICHNDEGVASELDDPDNASTHWIFCNDYFKKLSWVNSWISMQQYIYDLLHNSDNFQIFLYPNRVRSREDFLSTTYHEIIHHLTEIKMCKAAIKNSFNDALSWRRYLESSRKNTENYIILQEAIAHLEGGHYFIKESMNYSSHSERYKELYFQWNKASWFDYLDNPSENNQDIYAIWSQLWNMLYAAQISVYNYLMKNNTVNAQKIFFDWNTKLREYLIELILDPELSKEFFNYTKDSFEDPEKMISIILGY